MKKFVLVFSIAAIAGCTAAPDAPTTAAAPAPAAASTPSAPMTPIAGESKRASANGIVKSLDVATHSVTIQHGPVASLDWPAMTMTFQAPDVDLSTISEGDEVDFEFTSSGANATIDSISKR